MRMKTTILTLCLTLCLALVVKWKPSTVSAETSALLCGVVLAYNPATATTAGSINISGTTYTIAAGTTISGQAIISVGVGVCIDAVFNNSNQIVPPSAVGGGVVTACGGVNSFKAATLNQPGNISIGSANYVIAPNTTINGQSLINVGSNMCLTAALNGSGQVSSPSAAVVNITTSVFSCGVVSNYKAATSNATGGLTIGGMSFTIAQGVSIGNLTNGAGYCMAGVLDVNGQLVAPTSVGANAANETKVC
ncbi:MAG TPA: hypothetical protein PKC13_26030, partial [Blastocatellia bacterium]|nr:hypothetical protein [Blastocatellia bacterium]